jgi:signal transduction histidine kinase/DNA-binding response OmpR family regulator
LGADELKPGVARRSTTGSDPTIEPWNVLVVDDEEDVHVVTRLALKRREWRNRGFNVISARSAAEASQIITSPGRPVFHVAIVDVIMETPDAGLRLCRELRATLPSSLRIVLRTGQPGNAPEEVVLNDYDIDHYLAKPDVTAERLVAVIRACIRSSQDISTLLAFSDQLRNFTKSLQSVSTLEDLLVFMEEGLGFLETKYSCKTRFVYDIENDKQLPTGPQGEDFWLKVSRDAVLEAAASAQTPLPVVPGSEVGFHEGFIFPFQIKHDLSDGPVRGALFVRFAQGFSSEKNVQDFRNDAALFVENWKIAYSTLKLQEKVARERMLREQMYFERMQSIATMVTGVAHEINTPLGVANTASSMIGAMVARLDKLTDPSERQEAAADLTETAGLLTKNIVRAHELIKSFKQLSIGQLSDHRSTADLAAIVRDCIESMRPETRKAKLAISVACDGPEPMQWDGYPGHLSQVLLNFIQNALRYAYPDTQGGKVDIHIGTTSLAGGPGYQIAFRDYGKGVAADILPQIFEPFVTSARGKGGTGLGLAITYNIVTSLLSGQISCESSSEGTTFIVKIPRTVPLAPKQAPAAP